MNRQDSARIVRRSVTVPVSADHAFEVFTGQMTRWWSQANTFGKENYESVTVEPRSGGRWFERAADGSTTDWGQVLVWEPPRRVVLTWQITPQGLPEADPSKASVVEVRFEPEDSGTTRVELEHREFDRHGAEGSSIWYGAMDSEEGGWSYFLNRYAQAFE